MLGFAKNVADEFKLIASLKSLYCDLIIRLILDDGIRVQPMTAVKLSKFLAFAGFKLNIPHPTRD